MNPSAVPFDPAGTEPAPIRRLRRSREDRVAAGLCGGLGRYFGVDPVIFRVLLAVLVLFGGSGIVVYLLGWLAVPEQDAPNPPLDRLIARLRRRSVPFALMIIVAALIVWVVGFSWWAPFSIFPAAAVLIALGILLARRNRAVTAVTAVTTAPAYQPGAAGGFDRPLDPAGVQLRNWYQESIARSRARRRRSAPVRRITLGLLIASIAGLVVADTVSGIPFGTYFWVIGGITLAGLLVGLVSRRTPWSVTVLLLPALIGITTFGTSNARAHDGSGDRNWAPLTGSDVHADYRLGFGRSTLDLARLTPAATSGSPSRVRIVQGAGQVRLLIPRTLPVRIEADVHEGEVEIDGQHRDNGWDVSASYASPAVDAAQAVLTIDVELTAGQLSIAYV